MAHLGNWETDLATGQLFWSDEVYRIFGRALSSAPLVNEDFFAAVHAEDRERVWAASLGAAASGESYAIEHRIVRPDGVVRSVREQAEVVRGEQERAIRMVGTVQDITEQKRVEERLQQSLNALARAKAVTERQAFELAAKNSDLEQFAYIASHDLQEPLRSAAAYAQLLRRRYQGRLDSDADDFIGFIVENVGRMQRLIEALLEYSRAGQKPSMKTVDCEECLSASLSNLQRTLQETSAQVTRDPLPKVSGDATRLTQLFQNLIGNALKYRGNEPPRIEIEARREDSHWRLTVRDNGVGIDPQFHERIFEMFQRLHTPQERPGTGIGLALCKKIVEGHGGRLWVESQPGRGAAFHFTLPGKEGAAS
jgi:PAS domain S-box-containing protein